MLLLKCFCFISDRDLKITKFSCWGNYYKCQLCSFFWWLDFLAFSIWGHQEKPFFEIMKFRLIFITIYCYCFLLLITQFYQDIIPYWDEVLNGVIFSTFPSFDQIWKDISLSNIHLMIHKVNSTQKVRNLILYFVVVIREIE